MTDVILAANLRGVPGRVPDQRRTGSVSVLTCISQEVSRDDEALLMLSRKKKTRSRAFNVLSLKSVIWLNVVSVLPPFVLPRTPYLQTTFSRPSGGSDETEELKVYFHAYYHGD